MQYSNMALETTALVMCDPNTFFYVMAFFLLCLCELHKHMYDIINIINIISQM